MVRADNCGIILCGWKALVPAAARIAAANDVAGLRMVSLIAVWVEARRAERDTVVVEDRRDNELLASLGLLVPILAGRPQSRS